jgi:hypothetical protein
MEGYLTAMFYSYANNWLSGECICSYQDRLKRLGLVILRSFDEEE